MPESNHSSKPRTNPPASKYELALLLELSKHKIPYRHNHCIAGYYPDFWIVDTNILIEVDGNCHASQAAKQRDKTRTNHLKLQGYRVLRFSNAKIQNDMPVVVEKIKQTIAAAQSGKTGIRVTRQSKAVKQRAQEKAKQLNAAARSIKPK